jgi:hypothetical protein
MTDRHGNATEVSALAEGYPTLDEVIQALKANQDIRNEGVRRLELNAFASGDCTYQVWYVDREEAIGGYSEIG